MSTELYPVFHPSFFPHPLAPMTKPCVPSRRADAFIRSSVTKSVDNASTQADSTISPKRLPCIEQVDLRVPVRVSPLIPPQAHPRASP